MKARMAKNSGLLAEYVGSSPISRTQKMAKIKALRGRKTSIVTGVAVTI